MKQDIKSVVAKLSPTERKELTFYLENPEFERMPCQSLVEFIDNPYYLGVGEDTWQVVKEEGEKIWTLFLQGKITEAILLWGMGSGKCLAKGTKVLKYSGKIEKVENIEKGDLLMGNDSKPRKVLSITRGKEEMYKIIPIKGEPFVVNKSHILSLKRTHKRTKKEEANGHIDRLKGKIVNISVEDYLKTSKKFKSLHKLWRTGIIFPKKKVKIDPYWTGIWLGDGNSHNTGITTQDKEIVKKIYQYGKKLGLVVNVNWNTKKSCPTYILTSGQRKGGYKRNILLNRLKEYQLIRNKHIPFEYKTNSRKVRLQLLAGLIDSDGYRGNNVLEFSNKNKRLCEDVLFLCRSLGLAAYIKKRQTKCGDKIFDSYRISISGELSEIPTRLKRKQCSKRKQKKSVLVTGFMVEPMGIDEYYGFELNDNHLYLLHDFTVMHNSYLSTVLNLMFVHYLLCLKNPHKYFGIMNDKPIAVVNMGTTATQAKNVVFASLRKFVESSHFFQEYSPDILMTEIKLGRKNITLYCGNSQETMPIGMNVIFGILDEAAWYLDTEAKSTAENIYNILKNRIISRFGDRGFMMVISVPRYVDDFITRHYRESQGIDYIYTSKYKTWEAKDREKMSPETFDFVVSVDKKGKALETWRDIPMDFKKAADRNPERFMRDFGAMPSLVLEAFDKDADIIIRDVSSRQPPIDKRGELEDWFRCHDDKPRFIHIDLALKKDACGFAMGHKEGEQMIERERLPIIYIDLVHQIKPKPGEEIKFSEVRQLVYSLQERGFPVEKVTLDQYQSVDTIQILNDRGIEAKIQSVDRDIRAYETFKEALHQHRFDCYLYKPLHNEYKRLELVKGKKVDHPPGGSKDVTDAVAGVCRLVAEEQKAEPRLTMFG